MIEISVELSDFPIGRCRVIEAVDGRRVLVLRTHSGCHAAAGNCPHQQLSLDGARLVRGALLCPHHGARFDLEDGHSLSNGLTARPLPIYPVRIEDGCAIITILAQEIAPGGARGLPGSGVQPRQDKRPSSPTGR